MGSLGSGMARRDHEQASLTELEKREQYLVPIVGLAVDPYHAAEVADALAVVRRAKAQLDEARRDLEQLLALEAQRQGTKTIRAGDFTVEVSGGPTTEYDTEVLQRLLEVGLPDDRMGELIKTRVEYRVDRNVIRQLLGSGNPEYAEIIEKAASVVEHPWRVSVK